MVQSPPSRGPLPRRGGRTFGISHGRLGTRSIQLDTAPTYRPYIENRIWADNSGAVQTTGMFGSGSTRIAVRGLHAAILVLVLRPEAIEDGRSPMAANPTLDPGMQP